MNDEVNVFLKPSNLQIVRRAPIIYKLCEVQRSGVLRFLATNEYNIFLYNAKKILTPDAKSHGL